MNTTRRGFLKAAGVTTLLGAVPAMGAAQEADQVWDASFDVVVMGFGFAGASAAVNAAEAGADVLLIDKAPLDMEGGNSRYCAQLCLSIKPEDREDAITYYKNLRGRYDDQSDEVIEAIVDGLSMNRQWLVDHGMPEEDIISMPFPEYPEFEGAQAATAILYKGSWLSQLYQFMHPLALATPGVTFWPACAAVELVQEGENRAVTGVVVEHDGEPYRIQARNGVVMALGGFENNQQMLQNFVQQPGAYAKGAHFNTGDGVKMAIKVGADLWHMSTLSGADVNFIDPQTGIAAGYALTSATPTNYCTAFTRLSAIVVGGDGTRFMNEAYFPRHGHISYGGTYRSMLVPDNAWCVFDEAARQAGKGYHSWSDGMVEEIEKGWVLKADTLEELAGLTGISPEGLAATVAQYNGFCADGADPVCGRSAEFLTPIGDGPYYAFEVRPTNTNTQGGARRDTACRVLDVDGNPIPHLYSAGEFGSFYADIYNGGGNVGECIFTGIIAGKAAAEPKDDAASAAVVAAQPVDFSQTRPEFEPASDAERVGVATGIGGDLVVKVVLDGDAISAVEVLYDHETPNIGSKAIERIAADIVASQQTVVDILAGATVTSYAMINAVNDALGTGIVVGPETDLEELEASRKASVDQID